MNARRFVLLAALALGACGDDTSSTPEDTGPPAVQLIGRWDETGAHPVTAWPGGRVVAKFEGTSVKATLTGTSWVNVILDGKTEKKTEISDPIELTGLSAGAHVLTIEKRGEANRGTMTLQDITYGTTGKLLSPPARLKRRIEFVSDSTIDGFGADGDVKTCPESAPQYDDIRKSVAHFTADGLSAEPHYIAYSGKGIVQNEQGDEGENFPALYGRTLPDTASSSWDFKKWTPDVIVIALGGTDISSTTPPKGFQDGYDALVTSMRQRHPNAQIIMSVWSQIKDLTAPAGFATRTTLKKVLDAIKASHSSDPRLHVFTWKEADYPKDETGCAEHANEAHGKETAAELVPFVKNLLE